MGMIKVKKMYIYYFIEFGIFLPCGEYILSTTYFQWTTNLVLNRISKPICSIQIL